jgi:hypothetical protein
MALVFVVIGILLSSEGQSQTYFRYFEVEAEESFNPDELSNEVFEGSTFEIEATCATRSSLIVRVPATYPKRIEAIESEVLEKLSAQIPAEAIKGISPVKPIEVENYCQ